jgi:type I restriction enzyme S subunit
MEYALSELFTLQMGKTPSRDNSSYWKKSENNWISIADLTNSGKYISNTKETLSDSAVAESGIKKIPANTVIMSFKLSLGKVAITEKEMYSNEAIMAFIDKGVEKISPEYLYYLIRAKDWSKGTNKAVMGATLNKATLSTIKIQLHEYDNQLEIVNMLNRVSSSIDFRKQQLTKLDELVKARFVEMFGDPVNNPLHWKKVKLSELADIKIGPFGSLLHKEDYVTGGHPLVNPSHIIDGKIIVDNDLTLTDEKYSELISYHLKKDDIVLGRRGEMGRCAVVDREGLLCGTGSLLLRPTGVVTADYIQKIISFPTFKKTIEAMAVGQTMPNLNVPIVSNFMIILPPLSVQKEYYDFVAEVDKSKLFAELFAQNACILAENRSK